MAEVIQNVWIEAQRPNTRALPRSTGATPMRPSSLSANPLATLALRARTSPPGITSQALSS